MRRILKANIKFVSLVPAGANRLATVYKSDGSVQFQCMSKAADGFDDRGELLNVVYAPEVVDSQGDVASAEVIKEAAYDFIANGAGIDINHDNKPVSRDRAAVAESFIVQKGDARFADWKTTDGKPVNLEGAWATVIKIKDPELRKKYRTGEWGGVSMGGTAVVEPVNKSSGVEELVALLGKALKPSQPEQTAMDETKITKAVTDGITAAFAPLMEKLTKALEPKAGETKPEKKPDTDDTPVFKGRLDDLRGLELHARQVQLHQLRKSVDWNDPQSVREFREVSAELKETWAAEDAEAGIETKPVNKRLAAGPSSTAPAMNGNDVAALIGMGNAAAETINKSRGFRTAKQED